MNSSSETGLAGVPLPPPAKKRSGPGSKPRVDREARREQYLRIASAVFLRLGLSEATMQDVADAAGVPKVLIYRVFPSRQVLLEAILDRVMTAIHEAYVDRDYVYGARVRSLAQAARACPETFLLVLKYSQAGVEQVDWSKSVSDTFAAYTRRGWYEPTADAPPGAEARAEYASRLHVGVIIDTLIRWIEDRDGLTEEARMRWWGRISREYHLASRETFQLGHREYDYKVLGEGPTK